MGDVDERDAHLLLERRELELQRLAQLGVEGAERLVEQEHPGPQHEGPGEGHPLLLPARQLVRLALLEAGEPHQLQRLADARRWSRPWSRP